MVQSVNLSTLTETLISSKLNNEKILFKKGFLDNELFYVIYF